jgi:hypothetical protein
MVLLPGCPCCSSPVIAIALYGWGEPIDGVRPYDFNYVGMLTNPVDPITISAISNFPQRFTTVAQALSIFTPGANFETFAFGATIIVSVRIEGEFFYLNLSTFSFPFRPRGITYRKKRIDSFNDILQKKTVTFTPSDIVDINGAADSTLEDKAGSVIVSTDYELFSGPSARSTFIVTATPAEEVELTPRSFFGCPDLFNEKVFAYGNEEFSLTPSFVDNAIDSNGRNYEDVITDLSYEVRLRTVLFNPAGFDVSQENDGRNYRFYFLAKHRQIDRTYGILQNNEKAGIDYDCNDIITQDMISEEIYFTGFDSVAMRLIGGDDNKITISSPLTVVPFLPSIGLNPHVYTVEWIPDEE